MRGIVRRLVALALGLAIALPTAARADDELGLSNDGSTWNGTLAPLFDSSVRWVPGDTRVETFHARNQSTDGGDLRLRLAPKTRDLLDTGQLEIDVRSDGGAWTALGTGWTAPELLSAGDSTQIDIRATLLAAADNVTQALSSHFDVGVQLTYASPGTPPTAEPTAAPTAAVGDHAERDGAKDDDGAVGPAAGSLAGTGAVLPSWLVPAGLGAVLTGLWLAWLARRRDDDEQGSDLA